MPISRLTSCLTPRLDVLLATVAVSLAAGPSAHGQLCRAVVWCDHFGNYEVGATLIGQDCNTRGCVFDGPGCRVGYRWAAWDAVGGSIAAARVVNVPSYSVEIDAHDGNPATSENLLHEFFSLNPPINPTNAYKFRAEAWIPAAFRQQPAADSYFYLLNTYAPGGSKNFSTQLHFNSDTGTLVSDPDGAEIPFATNAWNVIDVIFDLPNDRQLILLNGDVLVDKQDDGWTQGVTGDGLLTLHAAGFHAGNSRVPIFYDNLHICRVDSADPAGACCLGDATCQITDRTTCEVLGGYFAGLATECDACDTGGDDGWELDAPFTWDGSGERGLTPARDGCTSAPFGLLRGDERFVITVPWAQRWTFDACNTALDVILGLGDAACDASRRVSADSPVCAGNGQAYVHEEIAADGATIHATIEAGLGQAGDFELTVRAQCPRLAPTPDARPEPEPCGDDTNGGCNADPPAFTPLACGDTVRGTAWFDGSGRDTDWYVLDVRYDVDLVITGSSVFAGHVFGVVAHSDRQDCDAVSVLDPAAATDLCTSDPRGGTVRAVLRHTNHDGGDPAVTRWWLFAAPGFGGPVQACDTGFDPEPVDPGDALAPDPDGQNGYVMTVTCRRRMILGDGSSFAVSTLLSVLDAWGTCGGGDCPEDLDRDGDVDFDDLRAVLTALGPS